MPNTENINALKNFAKQTGLYASFLEPTYSHSITPADITATQLQKAIKDGPACIAPDLKNDYISYPVLMLLIAGYFKAYGHPHHSHVYSIVNRYAVLRAFILRVILLSDTMTSTWQQFHITHSRDAQATKLNRLFDELMGQFLSHLPGDIDKPMIFVTHKDALQKIDIAAGYMRSSCEVLKVCIDNMKDYHKTIVNNSALSEAFNFEHIASHIYTIDWTQSRDSMTVEAMGKAIADSLQKGNKGLKDLLFKAVLKELK